MIFFLSFSVARKKVLFADGVAPGDESSSSGAEALRSPAKIAASKTRKKLRRKRTLKATGRKRLIDRLKLPVSFDAINFRFFSCYLQKINAY